VPDTLTLQGSGGTLSLEVVSDNGWCRCYLEAGEQTSLGAEDIQHIASRLLGALGEDDELAPVVGQLEGYNVRCALLLSEAHHALYVATEGQNRVLLWQNAAGTPMVTVGVIRLSPEQRHRWLALIQEMCPGVWPSFQGSNYLDQKPAG